MPNAVETIMGNISNSWREAVNANTGSNIGEDMDNVTFGQGLNNFFTGNVDYARQKEMAQNSYQWAVEDAKAAGLSPALFANGGGQTASAAPQKSGQGFSMLGQMIAQIGSLVMGGIKASQQASAQAITDKVAESTISANASKMDYYSALSNALKNDRSALNVAKTEYYNSLNTKLSASEVLPKDSSGVVRQSDGLPKIQDPNSDWKFKRDMARLQKKKQ